MNLLIHVIFDKGDELQRFSNIFRNAQLCDTASTSRIQCSRFVAVRFSGTNNAVVELDNANRRISQLLPGEGTSPDVTLHKDGDLIFTMDVKGGVRRSDALKKALDRLTYTVDKYGSQGYLVCVTKHLTFSVDNASDHFMKFCSAGCEVAGPKGGTLKSKMEEMGYSLLRLEECLDKICSVL